MTRIKQATWETFGKLSSVGTPESREFSPLSWSLIDNGNYYDDGGNDDDDDDDDDADNSDDDDNETKTKLL